MGTVQDKMQDLLAGAFAQAEITITDDSAKHAGHAGATPGGESHFTVRVVSGAFEGMSKVSRHRAIYTALRPLFDAGLHALAIEALTPAEVGN